jgi:alpha-glucosidase
MAIIYEDGPDADYRNNPYPMTIRRMEVNKASVLHLHLAAGGGAAIQLLLQK